MTPVSGSSVIKGLVINRFGPGIEITGDTVVNRIEGNFIGTDPSGTLDRGNAHDGVDITGGPSENVVGGATPAARNVVSGNDSVFVSGSSRNGSGQLHGHRQERHQGPRQRLWLLRGRLHQRRFDNTVGGATAGARNVVSGNELTAWASSALAGQQGAGQPHRHHRQRHRGPGQRRRRRARLRARTTPRGRHRRGLQHHSLQQRGRGRVQPALAATHLANSIFSNAGLGIDLGAAEDAAANTANDPGDPDTGANSLQNKPVITSAKTTSSKTTINGKLNSPPNTGYHLQFFSNPPATRARSSSARRSSPPTALATPPSPSPRARRSRARRSPRRPRPTWTLQRGHLRVLRAEEGSIFLEEAPRRTGSPRADLCGPGLRRGPARGLEVDGGVAVTGSVMRALNRVSQRVTAMASEAGAPAGNVSDVLDGGGLIREPFPLCPTRSPLVR